MPNMHKLIDSIEVEQVLAPASYNSEQNTDAVDMEGWDGAMFILDVGAMATNATLDAEAEWADDDAFSENLMELVDSQMTQLAEGDGDGDTVVIFDISGFMERRYLRLEVTPATAATILGVTVVKYRGRGGFPKAHAGIEEIITLEDPSEQAVS